MKRYDLDDHAAEVERLKGALATHATMRESLFAEVERLRAENERLRADRDEKREAAIYGATFARMETRHSPHQAEAAAKIAEETVEAWRAAQKGGSDAG